MMFKSGRKLLEELAKTGTGEAKLKPFKEMVAVTDMTSVEMLGALRDAETVSLTMTKACNIMHDGLDEVEVPDEVVHEAVSEELGSQETSRQFEELQVDSPNSPTPTVFDLEKDKWGMIQGDAKIVEATSETPACPTATLVAEATSVQPEEFQVEPVAAIQTDSHNHGEHQS